MDIMVENVSPNDIGEINTIQKLAFEDSYNEYKFCPAYEASDEQMASFLDKASAYKILLENIIIGSIFIYVVGGCHYELDTISIHPQYHNLGIGEKAIRSVEKLFPDAVKWTLSTPQEDYRNRHFYEKLGYKQIDTEVVNEHLTLIRYEKRI